MTSWYLVPAGHQLFNEFDVCSPDRDKTSDGTIGDAAHQKEVSDHNPDKEGAVRAIDVDNNLVNWVDMETVVQFLLARCRAGLEKRFTYIIYYRRIWEADNEWKERAYTGASAHTEHAHFSFSHNDTLADNIASFHLEDIPVALTAADKTWIVNTINAGRTDTDKGPLVETPEGHAVLSQQVPDYTLAGHPQTPFYVAFNNLVEVVMDLKNEVAEIPKVH